MSRNGAKYKLSHLDYSTGLYNLLLYYLGYLTVSYDFFFVLLMLILFNLSYVRILKRFISNWINSLY